MKLLRRNISFPQSCAPCIFLFFALITTGEEIRCIMNRIPFVQPLLCAPSLIPAYGNVPVASMASVVRVYRITNTTPGPIESLFLA